MSTPELDPHPWLPFAAVLDHLGIADPSPELTRSGEAIERHRRAAAEFCEDAKRDLFTTTGTGPGAVTSFAATARVVEAGLLAAARLFARRGAPLGTANYGEFAASILRSDPDVGPMLGVGRFAKPAAR